MNTEIDTDYLVASPSFLSGVGSIFNLSGGYYCYNEHLSGKEADAAALRRDWLKVAGDFKAAIKQSKVEVSLPR